MKAGRDGAWLLAALALCGALSALHRQSARRPAGDPVTGTVRDMALVPAQTATGRVARWGQIHLLSLFAGPRLAQQNSALTTQVARLTLQNQDLQAAQMENNRLRALLRFQQRSPRPLLAAEVAAVRPSPLTDTLLLARGFSDGVRPRAIVLAPDGALVGQVIDVSPTPAACSC